MHDFNCSDPHQMKSKEMAERAIYLKETEEGVAFMCKQMEDMRNEAVDAAVREKTVDYLNNMMATLKISLNQAMDALQIPEKDRDKYSSMMKQ